MASNYSLLSDTFGIQKSIAATAIKRRHSSIGGLIDQLLGGKRQCTSTQALPKGQNLQQLRTETHEPSWSDATALKESDMQLLTQGSPEKPGSIQRSKPQPIPRPYAGKRDRFSAHYCPSTVHHNQTDRTQSSQDTSIYYSDFQPSTLSSGHASSNCSHEEYVNTVIQTQEIATRPHPSPAPSPQQNTLFWSLSKELQRSPTPPCTVIRRCQIDCHCCTPILSSVTPRDLRRVGNSAVKAILARDAASDLTFEIRKLDERLWTGQGQSVGLLRKKILAERERDAAIQEQNNWVQACEEKREGMEGGVMHERSLTREEMEWEIERTSRMRGERDG